MQKTRDRGPACLLLPLNLGGRCRVLVKGQVITAGVCEDSHRTHLPYIHPRHDDMTARSFHPRQIGLDILTPQIDHRLSDLVPLGRAVSIIRPRTGKTAARPSFGVKHPVVELLVVSKLPAKSLLIKLGRSLRILGRQFDMYYRVTGHGNVLLIYMELMVGSSAQEWNAR